jgi:hypothetical protein
MPAGGSQVAWIDANDRLTRVDLATNAGVHATALPRPTGTALESPLALIGVDRQFMIAAA